MEPTTALATVDAAGYPVLFGGGDVTEALRENLAGERLNWSDLERVAVPAGGGLFWAVGDEPPTRNLDGIIVATGLVRSYWASGLEDNGGSSPPDCFSPDSITGIGTPGGSCEVCPLAQFGSAVKNGKEGRGQACKQMRQIYLLREGSALPTLLVIPPSSIKSIKGYLLGLASKQGLRYSQVVTRFTLTEEKNADGIKFGMVKASTLGKLTAEQAASVRSYGETFQASIARHAA